MRRIVLHLTDAELERWRWIETDMEILDSGAVSLSREEARAIWEASREFWIYLTNTYPDHMHEETGYQIDSIFGVVFEDIE
jgi:hypothetical protein